LIDGLAGRVRSVAREVEAYSLGARAEAALRRFHEDGSPRRRPAPPIDARDAFGVLRSAPPVEPGSSR
jgi:hypothetical protein